MPSEIRFDDFRKILEAVGYRLARVSGSHHVFTLEGREPFSAPVHKGKVKPVYVRKATKLAEAIAAEEQQNDEQDEKDDEGN